MKNPDIHSLILVGYSPAHNGWVSLLVNEAGEIFDHQTRKNWGLFGGGMNPVLM